VQTNERSEIQNLTQEALMTSRSVSKQVIALIEVWVNLVLVREVSEPGEGPLVP
jgi:hypothetical protein